MNYIGHLGVLFIVGIFFIWKGSIKISSKTELFPESKKIGRILGVLMLIPLIYVLFFMSPFSGLRQTSYTTSPVTTYSNHEYGFNMVFPTPVIVGEGNTKGEIVKFIDKVKEPQMFIAVNFINDIEINGSNFDSYVNNGVQQIPSAPGGVLVDNKKILSSMLPMYLTEHKIMIGSKLFHFMQLSVLAKNGQIFIVSGMSEDRMWLNFKDTIKDSLLSFSLQDKN